MKLFGTFTFSAAKFFLSAACIVTVSPAFAGTYQCSDVFAPQSLSTEIKLFINVFAAETPTQTKHVSTRDYVSFISTRLEPYLSQAKTALADVDWQNEAAELRSLLETQHRLSKHLAPGFLQRRVLKHGVHQLKAPDVASFLLRAQAHIQASHDTMDKIDRRERALRALESTLKILSSELHAGVDAFLGSDLPASAKQSIVPYIVRKIEMLNAQRALAHVQIPSVTAAKTSYLVQLADLENFLAIYGANLQRIAGPIEIPRQVFTPESALENIREIYRGNSRNPNGTQVMAYIAKKTEPQTGVTTSVEVLEGRILAITGDQVTLQTLNGDDFESNIHDLFFIDETKNLLPPRPYSSRQRVFVPSLKIWCSIIAIKPDGQTIVFAAKDPHAVQPMTEGFFVVSAYEMASIYYDKNFEHLPYKILDHFRMNGRANFWVSGMRDNGDVVTGYYGDLISAAEMKLAIPQTY